VRDAGKVGHTQTRLASGGVSRIVRVREGGFAFGRRGLAGVGGRCAAWSSLRPVAAQHPLHPTAQAGRNHPPERGLRAALVAPQKGVRRGGAHPLGGTESRERM